MAALGVVGGCVSGSDVVGDCGGGSGGAVVRCVCGCPYK